MSAGYLFSIGTGDKSNSSIALEQCFLEGRYATLLSLKWSAATIATMGDFITMQPGDNVYLFSNRLVYGIGEILEYKNGEAAVELFPGSSSKNAPIPEEETVIEKGDCRCFRWAVYFKPSPYFFTDGVDMDDLLNSDPDAFNSLRTFWKRSFIQLDDRENQAFKSAIIRLNEPALSSPQPNLFFPYAGDRDGWIHPDYSNKPLAEINPLPLLKEYRKADGSLSSEMVLEAGILSGLTRREPSICKALGTWDHISHQVAASPFKPVDYMDRIDIFAYRWVDGYRGEILSKYLVVELKKGPAVLKDSAPTCDYNQLMKYVDWVCDKYAHGNYSMIEAVLVAHSFEFSNASLMKDEIVRPYVTGHQAQSHTWNDMRFATYNVTEDGQLTLDLV